jgi:hypothetical protein
VRKFAVGQVADELKAVAKTFREKNREIATDAKKRKPSDVVAQKRRRRTLPADEQAEALPSTAGVASCHEIY